MGIRAGSTRPLGRPLGRNLDDALDRAVRAYRDDLRAIRELVTDARRARHPRSTAAALDRIDRVASRGLIR